MQQDYRKSWTTMMTIIDDDDDDDEIILQTLNRCDTNKNGFPLR
jgi:hypothetical protein